MVATYKHYKAQAALCQDMAAAATDERLAREWTCLANLWLSMAARRFGDDAGFDLMSEGVLPSQEAAPLTHRSGAF